MTSASKYVAAILLLGGCSVINSLEDVKPALKSDAGTGASGRGGRRGSGGGAGNDASAGGGTTGGGGASETGGAGGGSQTGGQGGTSGRPNDGGGADVFVPGGNNGVIVAYNKPAAPLKPQLLVLHPADGTQLSAEEMGAVKGIVNDALTDLWYIFEQKGTPLDPLVLHVRELRTSDGKWLEIGTKSGVPYPASRIVTLNGRLAYLSTTTPISPDPLTHTLTILDTTDPTRVTVLGGLAGEHRALPAGRKQGLLGRPASGGGTVDVIYFSSSCPVGDAGVAECDVNLAAYPVGPTATVTTSPTTKAVGKVLTSSTAQFEQDTIRNAVVLALPALVTPSVPDCSDPTTATDLGSVQKFSPQDFSGVGQAPVSFKIVSQQLSGGAYDPCFDVMFVTTQLYDRAIWGIPLGGGAPIKLCSGTGGASMLFEPRTRTLIRPPTGGGAPEFFALGGTAVAPTLKSVSLGNLPPKFTPVAMAVRQYKSTCPP
jgi:hypothetical protein